MQIHADARLLVASPMRNRWRKSSPPYLVDNEPSMTLRMSVNKTSIGFLPSPTFFFFFFVTLFGCISSLLFHRLRLRRRVSIVYTVHNTRDSTYSAGYWRVPVLFDVARGRKNKMGGIGNLNFFRRYTRVRWCFEICVTQTPLHESWEILPSYVILPRTNFWAREI